MAAISSLILFLLLVCASSVARSETLHIVTEPWAPYVYVEDGEAKGIDYDITEHVFHRLGIEVEWQFLPWRRCLAMLQKGEADGALDIFRTAERSTLLLYPSEPLSDIEFVLYQANARPKPYNGIQDLRGLKVGTQGGYHYAAMFSNAAGVTRENGPNLEANFGKLLRGRVDLVITDRRAGRHALKDLGLEDQISQLPVVISRDQQFLAVRRNAGMDLLIQRFAAELKRFKLEPGYAELVARYADSPANPSKTDIKAAKAEKNAPSSTAGQQERSAL